MNEANTTTARILARWGAGGALAIASLAVIIDAGCQSPVTKAPPQAQPAPQQRLSFNQDIEPILAESCFGCHGPDPGSRKAGLRLDRAEFALAGRGKSGPAIIPGNPSDSPLIRRIESTDPKQVMPPLAAHKTLKPSEIAVLRRWVSEGAVYQEHWSFITPVSPKVPSPREASGIPQNPVDCFILDRLQRAHLEFSQEADKRSLLRRVSLDLTGLPPSPSEVDAFIADQRPDAYERAVDRLLASPRFGEHRAHYWLDYVRYADTHGIHFDNYRAIWPYRDYVIRAFNSNKPFDRFIREQLAGDLLPARSWDELAATGYVRSNLTTNEGGDIPEETYVNQTRDRVETFGVAFLGLTTGCAACHDHKFDPFTQRDFYGLAAYLNNTAEKAWDMNIADPAPVVRLPKDENRPAAEMVLARRADIQARLDERRRQGKALAAAWIASGHLPVAVGKQALELRLKLDEGSGDTVHNSAPGATVSAYKAETNPIVWGENTWLWPSMRMDMLTRLKMPTLGDVEFNEAFSAGGWIMLRLKPGNGNTGDGSVLSRMGDSSVAGGAGWELYYDKQRFVVNLVGRSAAGKQTGATQAASVAAKPSQPGQSLSVSTRATFPRDEWLHVFFTYDGSRRPSGIKLYVNGNPVEVDTLRSNLAPDASLRTPAALELGRRDDFEPMRETRFQDIRFFRRALDPSEVGRLGFEDVAADIVALKPNPATWTRDEAYTVVRRWYLDQVDPEAKALAAAFSAHSEALAALTKDGQPSLIAEERPTPGYADLLKRGDYYSRVERVGPATPHFLPPTPAGAPEDRRALADWLLSADQPLFGRVVVNRVWQEIFGTGLVETAGDFGVMGAKPSHPELLDWLAVHFRESGWDTKALYRLIVMSQAYRQSSVATAAALAADPSNRLLSRGPRFRMDAEMLRDSALAVSGLLVEKVGGPPVKPYQPAGLWEEVAMPESNTRTYVQDHGENLYRRSVYTFWKRASMPPSMEAFDGVSRETVCPRRARSNTPLQAFVTMNDPQWFEAARHLAEDTLTKADAPTARLTLMAQAALGRDLTPRELGTLETSHASFEAYFRSHAEAADQVLSVGESPVPQHLGRQDLAAWTLVASQFLNLDEFLTK